MTEDDEFSTATLDEIEEMFSEMNLLDSNAARTARCSLVDELLRRLRKGAPRARTARRSR